METNRITNLINEPSISAPKPVNATIEFDDDMDFAYIPTDGPATVEMVNATKDNFDVDDLVKSSDKLFTELLGLIKKMLPVGNEMVEKTYQAKKVMRLMGSGYKKIHVCINNYLLYWKNDKDLTACRTCGTSRWKVDNKTKKVYENIPAKVMWYFPIIPRLQRLFKIESISEDLRWHATRRITDGVLRHPIDSQAWHTIDEKFPKIAKDTRNLRLGISADGVDVNTRNRHHSVWPVLTVIYNLPPWLWVDTYDASTKDNFNLRTVVLWKINDYPALGTLCGCPYSGFKENQEDTRGRGGKIQKQKRNTTEEEGSSSQVNGQNGVYWKKFNIWYRKLKYWRHNPVPHCIDFMHVEKNVAESIVGTLLHVPGKTKDGLNARLDLAELGVKPELFAMQDEDKTTLPPAGYTLTNAEKDIFCETLHNIKVPEGYCSNFSSLVNLKDRKLIGLKSHDYHMLMQEFLPRNGYSRKGQEESKNDQTKHGMEKTKSNQGQSQSKSKDSQVEEIQLEGLKLPNFKLYHKG
ncbi:hypothetical protein Tco_0280478 [Tanacetum coccineum]